MIKIILFISIWGSLYSQSKETLTITLDGKIDTAEWKTAKSYPLQGGGEVKIMDDQNYIYIATRGDADGWTHVYAKHGTIVKVLHASAALGMSIYEVQQNSWNLTQSFKWELRDRNISAKAVQGRIDYLKNNGWVATLNTMNPKEQEFIIAHALFDSTKMRIAVVRASDAKSPHYWPETLKDGTLVEKLVYGEPPQSLTFDFTTWFTLY